MFMREGTPSGFKTMSTGVPSDEVGHVLLGKNPGDDALVAVTTRHLVADAELALDGHVDLDHLEHARRQLVALLEPGDLLVEDRLDHRGLLFDVLEDPVQLLLQAPSST